MSYQIELRHLRYYRALVEENHFRKAAEKLFISQPGLSKQIKNLEDQLEFKLIDRDKRSIKLTEAGKYFYEETIFILNHLNQTVNHSREVARGYKGLIRIGFVGSAMQEILPIALLKLNNRHPGLNTSLEELNNHDQVDKLIHDQLDVGFIRQRNVPSQLKIQAVHKDTFSVVLPATLKIDNDWNFASLAEQPFILFSPRYSPEYYDTVISICRDFGFEPKITHKTVHANTIFRLVENGMGISIVPTALTKGFDLNILFKELESVPQRTTLYMATKPSNRNPALKYFLENINLTIT